MVRTNLKTASPQRHKAKMCLSYVGYSLTYILKHLWTSAPYVGV